MNPRWAGNAAPRARSGFGRGDAGFPVRSPLPVGAMATGAGATGLGTTGGAGVWPNATAAHTAPVNRSAILCDIDWCAVSSDLAVQSEHPPTAAALLVAISRERSASRGL